LQVLSPGHLPDDLLWCEQPAYKWQDIIEPITIEDNINLTVSHVIIMNECHATIKSQQKEDTTILSK
jgi:hypothetical protein